MNFNHNNVDTYIYKLLNNNECFYKNMYIYSDLQLNFMIDNKTFILFIYILIIHFLQKIYKIKIVGKMY